MTPLKHNKTAALHVVNSNMKITINGNEENIGYEMTIYELFSVRNVESPEMMSVEHNGIILDKSDFSRVRIREGDKIEFLYFMGGGSLL